MFVILVQRKVFFLANYFFSRNLIRSEGKYLSYVHILSLVANNTMVQLKKTTKNYKGCETSKLVCVLKIHKSLTSGHGLYCRKSNLPLLTIFITAIALDSDPTMSCNFKVSLYLIRMHSETET